MVGNMCPKLPKPCRDSASCKSLVARITPRPSRKRALCGRGEVEWCVCFLRVNFGKIVASEPHCSHTRIIYSLFFSRSTNLQYGKLGHGNERGEQSPRRVEALANIPVAQIACGSRHTAVVSRSGDVYTWCVEEDGC